MKQVLESYALGGAGVRNSESTTLRINRKIEEGWLVKSMVASGNMLFILYEIDSDKIKSVSRGENTFDASSLSEAKSGNQRYISEEE